MSKVDIQKVAANHGWLWIRHGYNLIMRSPVQSMLMVMVFAMGIFTPALVPVIGPILGVLIMPVLMAGYMRVCRSLEYSEKINNRHILAGFSSNTKQLVAIGGMLLLGLLFISTVTTILGGTELAAILENFKTHQDPNLLVEALLAQGSGVETSLMAGMILLFMLVIAMQFAPMLVLFDQLTAWEAMVASLRGTFRNIVPYLVYSLIMQLIAFVAGIIPMKLGWIIMLPLGMTSMYVAYRDIFSKPIEADSERDKAT